MAETAHATVTRAGGLTELARQLLSSARTWSLYPSDHPAVVASMARLEKTVEDTLGGASLLIGVTNDTLIVDGASPETDKAVADAAYLLHDRGILQIMFGQAVPASALRALLGLLALDAVTLRDRGGPAQVWTEFGEPSIEIEQIDYRKVLEDGVVVSAARRDDLWRAIVQSILDRRRSLDEPMQQRLLEIAGDSSAIAELAKEVMEPARMPDGSPLITTQAAAVLAAYKQLTTIVGVLAPHQLDDVMKNLVAATSELSPAIAAELFGKVGGGQDVGGESSLISDLAKAFDDEKVAQLLAMTLAMQGHAAERLATVFSTLAPSEERRGRILTMTRSALSQQLFNEPDKFSALWSSLEELLVTYDDQRFMSEQYRAALNQVNLRSEAMAQGERLPELDEWLVTVNQEHIRTLSVTLMLDLLRLEDDAARTGELLDDISVLAEDLLLASDFEETVRIARVLHRRAGRESAAGSEQATRALKTLADCPALAEAIDGLGDMPDPEFEAFRPLCPLLGADTVPPLRAGLLVENETLLRSRAAEVILGFKAAAVPGLMPLVHNDRWYVQRNVAELLGRLGVPEAVAALQPLLRSADARVLEEAVRATADIQHPSAARAIQTVLRSSTGEQRAAVVAALLSRKDKRVLPLLIQIVEESEPFGGDHQIVLETLAAMDTVADDRAISPLVRVLGLRTWFRFGRTRAVRHAALKVLTGIGSARAKTALQELSTNGPRAVRGMVRQCAASV